MSLQINILKEYLKKNNKLDFNDEQTFRHLSSKLNKC
jgi:hypothetical protein